jgi:hypothetical protein
MLASQDRNWRRSQPNTPEVPIEDTLQDQLVARLRTRRWHPIDDECDAWSNNPVAVLVDDRKHDAFRGHPNKA